MKKNDSSYLFEGYLVSSLATLIFFSLFSFKGQDPGPDHFFLACIGAVTYYFVGHLWGWSSRLREEGKLGTFFLVQFLFLQAYAFEIQDASILFLAIVPIIAGVYFLNSSHLVGLKILRGRGAILLAIGPFSYLTFMFLTQNNIASYTHLVALSSLALWSAGLVSWGDIFKTGRVGNTRRRGDERLFVHDLVNQTHGLYLYLNFKATAEEYIGPDEATELMGEVKILQSLIKDHFGYEHRNLNDTMDWVSFEQFKKAHKKMVESFLPGPLAKVSYIYTGWIAEAEDLHLREKCVIHFPSVYRVMVNIVKNMADEHTSSAEFIFHYDESGFHISTKNKMVSLARDEDLSEGLTRLILNDKKLRVGDGLESIGALCQKLGGTYSFQIVDGHWVNDIYLPDRYLTKKVA